MNSFLSSVFAHVIFIIDGSIGVRSGSGGNNQSCINPRTRTHSCVHYFLHTFPPAAAASAHSSISSPFVAKGCGGRSNTPGPRCLNSGPKALICAYQSGTDNPWHSSSVNQEQIECRQRPIAFVAGDNDVCTHTYTLHVEVRPVEGIRDVSLSTDTCVLWPLSTINRCGFYYTFKPRAAEQMGLNGYSDWQLCRWQMLIQKISISTRFDLIKKKKKSGSSLGSSISFFELPLYTK